MQGRAEDVERALNQRERHQGALVDVQVSDRAFTQRRGATREKNTRETLPTAPEAIIGDDTVLLRRGRLALVVNHQRAAFFDVRVRTWSEGPVLPVPDGVCEGFCWGDRPSVVGPLKPNLALIFHKKNMLRLELAP